MGIDRRHLQVWVDPNMLDPDIDPASLPTLPELLYAFPNPDGEGKKCGNCVSYARGDQRCFIHEPSLKIADNQVCGYHVNGEPVERFDRTPKMDPVTPEFSGLVTTLDGAYCGVCCHFSMGECNAAQEEGGFARVEDLACCARWKARD